MKIDFEKLAENLSEDQRTKLQRVLLKVDNDRPLRPRCTVRIHGHRCWLEPLHIGVHDFGGGSWASHGAVLRHERGEAGYCNNPTRKTAFCVFRIGHEGAHRWKPKECTRCADEDVGWCTCHLGGVSPVMSRKRKERALDVLNLLTSEERRVVFDWFCCRCGAPKDRPPAISNDVCDCEDAT